MAITIEQEPSKFEPIGRDLILVVSTDNAAQPKFQYVFDVKVNGVLKGRVLISQNNSNAGVFNFRELCQDQLTPEIFCKFAFAPNIPYGFQPGAANPTNIYQQTNGDAQLRYKIEIGESYASSATTAPVIYPALAVADGFLWLASIPPYRNYEDSTTEIFSNNTVDDELLSDRVENLVSDCAPYSSLSPYNQMIERVNSKSWRTLEVTNDNGTLNGNTWTNIVYEAVKTDGTVLTHSFPVTQTSGFTFPQSKINIIPCGPANITYLDNHIPVGDQPNNLGSLLDYYKIYVTDAGGVNKSVVYNFVWDYNCCGGVYRGKFETATIMWLNTRGGYDYFDFNMRTTVKINVSKKKYRKVRGNYANTGPGKDFTYNAQERGLTDSQNYETREWNLSSDWVFESDYWSLSSLFSSSSVFLLTTLQPSLRGEKNSVPVSIPVNVKDSNFSVIQTNGKQPQTLSLNVMESNNRFLPNN